MAFKAGFPLSHVKIFDSKNKRKAVVPQILHLTSEIFVTDDHLRIYASRCQLKGFEGGGGQQSLSEYFQKFRQPRAKCVSGNQALKYGLLLFKGYHFLVRILEGEGGLVS